MQFPIPVSTEFACLCQDLTIGAKVVQHGYISDDGFWLLFDEFQKLSEINNGERFKKHWAYLQDIAQKLPQRPQPNSKVGPHYFSTAVLAALVSSGLGFRK